MVFAVEEALTRFSEIPPVGHKIGTAGAAGAADFGGAGGGTAGGSAALGAGSTGASEGTIGWVDGSDSSTAGAVYPGPILAVAGSEELGVDTATGWGSNMVATASVAPLAATATPATSATSFTRFDGLQTSMAAPYQWDGCRLPFGRPAPTSHLT